MVIALTRDRIIYRKNYYAVNKLKMVEKQKEWRKRNREYVNNYMRNYMQNYRNNKCLKYRLRTCRGKIKLEPKRPYHLKIEEKDIVLTFD